MSRTQIIFAVFDKKARAYQNFFFANSIASAIRSFQLASNDEKTELNKFPDDFELFKICEIDVETAIVTNVEITALGLARTYLKNNTLENLQAQFANAVEKSQE